MALKSEQLQLPFFNIGIEPVPTPDHIIFPHSCAWAVQGNKLLMIGGRIEGFHGLSHSGKPFSSQFANNAIRVVDLTTYAYSDLKLNMSDPNLLMLAASNMQFFQEGNALYIVGGFGIGAVGDAQSNVTHQTMMEINVSAMISAVENQGNPLSGIVGQASSPFIQVTGGELFKAGDIFYLVGGQNYSGTYQVGITGTYTDSIRMFSYNGTQITNTNYYQNPMLHRRDFNLVPIQNNSKKFYALFGGVFTKNNGGYQNPVYIHTVPNLLVNQDTLVQTTSQYNCAKISLYDSLINRHTTVLMGGIGRYQYHPDTGNWEDGDMGAKLPFVNTITQLIHETGTMTERVQLPPDNFKLPELLGANAIFLPKPEFLYSQDGIIDYRKLPLGRTAIGVMVGGIKSIKPTSSAIYPSTLNRIIYQVYIYILYPPEERK